MRLRDPRLLLLVSVALLAAAVAFPLGVIASHQFTDVPNTNTFHADIDALADAGVTTGCAAGKYCPKDFVTREQMAAFLNRLGALQAGKPPVVNATRLDGLDSTSFMLAGDVAIRQIGTWYTQLGGPTIDVYQDYEAIQSDTANLPMFARLDGPTSIGGQTYGIKSVEICYTGIDTVIQSTVVSAYMPTAFTALIASPTDHSTTPAACYTVSDGTPNAFIGSAVVELQVDFATDSFIGIGAVTTTWTPID